MISAIAVNVLFWSTIITEIVNPDNLAPNEEKIFPIEVAENFSRFIYIFNISNFLLGLIGIYLINGVQEFFNYLPGDVTDDMIS